MFTFQTKDIETGGETFGVQALSSKKLRKAQDIARGEALAQAKDTGAELIKAFGELAKAEAAGLVSPEMRRRARYRQYDPAAVIQAGVRRWPDEAPPTDPLERLHESQVQDLVRGILDLSLPALEDVTEVPKGASAPSTGS